jgi:hypothetical protein
MYIAAGAARKARDARIRKRRGALAGGRQARLQRARKDIT